MNTRGYAGICGYSGATTIETSHDEAWPRLLPTMQRHLQPDDRQAWDHFAHHLRLVVTHYYSTLFHAAQGTGPLLCRCPVRGVIPPPKDLSRFWAILGY